MKYPNSSQTIPENVLVAVKFAAQTGFISKHLWQKRFGAGCATWKIRQFSKLLDKDFFKPYLSIEKNQFYKLGASGHSLARKLGVKPVSSPLSNQILHDVWIYETAFVLTKNGYVCDWKTEAQLKSGVLLNSEDWSRQIKIPDAALLVNIKGHQRTIACEYERTLKTTWRIKETLRAYSGFAQFPLIVVICDDEVIRQAYLKILKQMNDSNLNKRIGLALIDGWHSSPELQPIQMLERSYQLHDVLQVVPKN
jgi:hypothetical protein